MSTPPTITSAQYCDNPTRHHNALTWGLSLYGTAIGAGVLFLPIDAGLGGIWPLLLITLLAFPMTFFSHQALCRVVLSGACHQDNITAVVTEFFGTRAGHILTLLYFLSIYPILLLYSVAITNTAESFLVHQMGISPPSRPLLAFVLITTLMLIIRFGQEVIIKSMSLLVYPFVIALVALSCYLIPYWNGAIFQYVPTQPPTQHNLLLSSWLVIPVVVFAFNHSPIISSFAVHHKQHFAADADTYCSHILKYSHVMMITTVFFFVFSCIFSLSPEDLQLAKQQNISILSYLANHFQTPIIAYMAPLIALIAIAKSFLGHYLGAHEGLVGITTNIMSSRNIVIPNHKLALAAEILILLSCWLTAILNPNILTIIETLIGPVVAFMLFLMPMFAIITVPAMQKYYQPIKNSFIIVIGFTALSAILYGVWGALLG